MKKCPTQWNQVEQTKPINCVVFHETSVSGHSLFRAFLVGFYEDGSVFRSVHCQDCPAFAAANFLFIISLSHYT